MAHFALIVEGTALAAAIRMMDQTGRRPAYDERNSESRQNQGAAQTGAP